MLFLEPQPFLRTAAANAIESPKETLEKNRQEENVFKKQTTLPSHPGSRAKKIAQNLAEGNPCP